MTRAILDTSVFIAGEQQRPLAELPDQAAVSVATLAELEIGVLVAPDARTRATRLATFMRARQTSQALAIDEHVASAFARLVAELKQEGRTLRVQDAWIAATAIAHGAALCTQDSDFDDVPGVAVIRV